MLLTIRFRYRTRIIEEKDNFEHGKPIPPGGAQQLRALISALPVSIIFPLFHKSRLFVHLLPLAVGRVRVLWVYLAVALSLVHLVDSTWVTAGWNLTTGWRVSNRR